MYSEALVSARPSEMTVRSAVAIPRTLKPGTARPNMWAEATWSCLEHALHPMNKEFNHGPSHPEQHRGVQHPPSADGDILDGLEVDGEAFQRLPHQPRGRRRRRPRDQ